MKISTLIMLLLISSSTFGAECDDAVDIEACLRNKIERLSRRLAQRGLTSRSNSNRFNPLNDARGVAQGYVDSRDFTKNPPPGYEDSEFLYSLVHPEEYGGIDESFITSNVIGPIQDGRDAFALGNNQQALNAYLHAYESLRKACPSGSGNSYGCNVSSNYRSDLVYSINAARGRVQLDNRIEKMQRQHDAHCEQKLFGFFGPNPPGC